MTAPVRPQPLVLVVDDDPTPRLLMRAALEQVGFQVAEAADGTQALACFARLHPALVLLDVLMPGLNGFETCAALRRQPGGEHTAVIMVTGLDDLESINRAYEVGATDFITKPINWPLLGHRVKYVWRASRAMEDLHHSKEALRESEERLTAIFETASDAIVTLDLDGIATSVNRAAEKISGYSREEIIGKPLDLFFTPESAALAHERTEKALRGDSLSPTFEIEGLRKDGTTVPLEVAARFLAERGNPIGIVSVLRDITLEKELEQQRREFLAMLSHDIKNPIGVIQGYTDILLETAREHSDTEYLKILDRLKSNAQMVLSLVTNYLNLAQLEAGQLILAQEAVDLSNILRQVGQQYETEAQRKHLTLTVELREQLPLVTGDPLGLERVVTNLVHNAVKFTPAGGQITLRSEHHDGEVVATVTDTGSGIAPEDLPFLFEKYRRSPHARTTEGMGLGLFIARELVKAHNGRIEVTSTLGQGTCFRVHLPVRSPE